MRTRTAYRTGAAVAVALVLGLTGACGGGRGDGGDGGKDGTDDRASTTTGATTGPPERAPAPAAASPRPGPTGIGARDGRVLAQGELDRAVLATGDVSGFEVRPMDPPPARGETADRRACAPLVGLINGTPEPRAKAVAYRQLVGGDGNGGPAVSEFLTAHGVGDARTLLSRLSTAIGSCADGFTARGGDGPSTYTGVRRLDVAKTGDDALAYEVTGDYEGDPVPLVFHLVRVGGTVATFYTANFESGTTPILPAGLLTAQAAKLA
ncbi:hypothetical protein [Streptomyces sp. NPDC095613]|uniref:hypothetical protein n=1 Tax=Streptomyces sp. NPDC095613 TaxID=3155540 RepID=UPI0033335697